MSVTFITPLELVVEEEDIDWFTTHF